MRLLSQPNANPKTSKNAALGYLTAPLHLAPHNLAMGSKSVCPNATAGCIAACLHTAGNPVYMRNKNKSRIARTQLFFSDREAFVTQLVREIDAHIRAAKRHGLRPAIRLNATSDLPWHTLKFKTLGGKTIIEAYPGVTFYDYTKAWLRVQHALPSNYSLTLSRSERTRDDDVEAIVRNGHNVAVVFATRRGGNLPSTYLGHTVIDGDLSDCRFLDPRGVIVGLRAKGDACKDVSGFVVQV